MFAAAEFLSCSSYDSPKYKYAWIKARVIRSSILSSGEFPDAYSRALIIAPNHKDIPPLWLVNSAISPKNIYQCNYLTLLSHVTSVGIKIKQTKERKIFALSNIVSIVSSPLKKLD